MVVTANESFLTIGGGHLEFQCIAQARALLESGERRPHTEDYSLGARLGQCCGGMTTILFEPLMQAQPEILVFGAGHVGQALVSLLATLPCHVNWIDGRDNQFASARRQRATARRSPGLRGRGGGGELLYCDDAPSSAGSCAV